MIVTKTLLYLHSNGNNELKQSCKQIIHAEIPFKIS